MVRTIWKRLTTPRAEKKRLILELLGTQSLSAFEIQQRSDWLLGTYAVYTLLFELEREGLIEHIRISAERYVYRRLP